MTTARNIDLFLTTAADRYCNAVYGPRSTASWCEFLNFEELSSECLPMRQHRLHNGFLGIAFASYPAWPTQTDLEALMDKSVRGTYTSLYETANRLKVDSFYEYPVSALRLYPGSQLKLKLSLSGATKKELDFMAIATFEAEHKSPDCEPQIYRSTIDIGCNQRSKKVANLTFKERTRYIHTQKMYGWFV